MARRIVFTAAVLMFAGMSLGAQQGARDRGRPIGPRLSGRITDSEGHPVAGAFISLRKETQSPDGQIRITMAGLGVRAYTDADGRYQFDDLGPGEFYVVAIPHNPPYVGGHPNEHGLRITYFPGTISEDHAKRVTVDFLRTATADFALAPAKLATISGIVIDDDEQPAAGGMISVSHADGLFGMDPFQAPIAPNGLFRLPGIPPGTYYLSFTRTVGRPTSIDGYRVSRVQVKVDGLDLGNVRVAPFRRVHVSGQLVLADHTLKSLPLNQIRLGFSPMANDALPGPQSPLVLHDDLSFDVDAWPLHMRPRVWIGGTEVRLASAQLDGVDVLKDGIDLTRGKAVAGLVVTLGPSRPPHPPRTSGSGPLRTPVSSASMAATSSEVSEKSKTSMFSLMRSACADLGITDRPCSMCQQSTICAGVLSCVFAIA
jgi:hypothetical protein